MKNIVTETIFEKQFNGDLHKVRFSDLPNNIQPNDIIQINREDSYHSEDESYDAFTELIILREREETDEEYNKRIKKEKLYVDELKKRRYETYLKLKKEFENE